MSETRREQGFTLIEVLVALLILGLAAAAVFRVLFHSNSELARSRTEQDALMVARSALVQVGRVLAAQPGHFDGQSGNIRWKVDVDDQIPDPPPAMGLAAYPVHVTVTWQDDRGIQAVTLNSVRLGKEHAEP